MKRLTHILTIVIISLFIISCRKEQNISTDSHLKLEFSSDSLLFDTVFTSIGSTTHELMIYNRHDDALNISNIRIVGGDSSPFKLNVDGKPVPNFTTK